MRGATRWRGRQVVDFRFTGREFDAETGFYYYRSRYYDPNTGRFLSEDPLRFDAADFNLYRYVFNNPNNLRDPSGKIIPLVIAGGIAAGEVLAAAETAAAITAGTNIRFHLIDMCFLPGIL